jgi:hypothetical protein
MLRHCIMQMQRQTYRVDHVIYMNASGDEDESDNTVLDYGPLIEDACEGGSGGRVFLGSGKTKSCHANYVEALGLIDPADYDLFLKIDDDDFYYRGYAQGVVDDFAANAWDYSGTYSYGLLNGRRWYPDHVQKDLGLAPQDIELDIPGVMPSTAAYSRRAMQAILASPDMGRFEDTYWRRVLATTPGMVIALRHDRNFVYNIHGGNASTGTWLRPDTPIAAPTRSMPR